MIQPFSQWILAAVLAGIVSAVAIRIKSLAPSGAIAAILLGTVVVGTGGWWPGVILVAFFVSSSLISQSGSTQARGSRRDWVQVIANGWGVLLGCVLYAISGWEPWLLFGIGAIAAATADTWSSEIGRFSTSPPRLITNGKIVPPGTSGAISRRGTVASFGGAMFIAALTVGAVHFNGLEISSNFGILFLGITLASVSGGFLDSVLGATVQEQRWCDVCEVATEANPHNCGNATRHSSGIAGLNNDVVNILCVLTGALIAAVSGIL